jgi:hypothetical protein
VYDALPVRWCQHSAPVAKLCCGDLGHKCCATSGRSCTFHVWWLAVQVLVVQPWRGHHGLL